MAEYRAYIVGPDGHFAESEPIVCRDDDEATERAMRLLDGHDIELWSGERLVIRLAHGPSADEVDAAMDGVVEEGARPKPLNE